MKEAILFRREWNEEYPFHLNKEEISHLKALRIFSEDKNLRVLNGIGTEWIYEIPGNSVQGIFKKTITHLKSERVSAVATAIPKGNRLEWLLQKGTELGLTHFYFLNFEQSDRKDFNLNRAQKIVEEASIQSKRIFLPEIVSPVSLKEFLISQKKQNLSIYRLDPQGEWKLKPEFFQNAIWIIGPEGGFREKEILLLQEKNIPGIKVGDTILKIETAVVFTASLFRYSTIC
ncbi:MULTISPECIES: 16S rRNA (uracil(1498)-N(3))-methyltransferase [Leptospira]|uniref:Ribosomal RNA small subunit methyltransferase E n=1 Tax=Leptospira interrogans str. FPW1039 TaxID=1193040 RepID=A0A0F6I863_LEPIR|nr:MULTISPECIES: 16S rRNA (uracil(1498)-N(3))-methyltransferase [Leptospira]EKR84948.1 RNA methyltransferase, RsmE family [Leptospira interrogans str. UI 08452]EMJ34238.1 RNA methyltransferase, RsmE family [Leptospira interrogans str. FPW1039]EMN34734.1 RNA methyltransferase, RsmE family [Leptospira interrogans serovar Medanensis str. L0448]EMN39539.1 RNA methyltransferase, RsmE family [Leptospira interrogans str. L0996]EMN97317.1 RNA methyltransferase, RsmE family [Leptospira interrogans sero